MTAKNYFQDRLILLLLSINIFLALMAVTLVILRVSGSANGFIVQYRSNLGISEFQNGSISSIFSFMGFAVLTLLIHAFLSWRTYTISRHLAMVVLALGSLLLLLCVIVSNALLALH